MNHFIEIVLRHGYVALFAYVLLSQIGTPMPSAPLLLAAGALSAAGSLSAPRAIIAVVVAGLCADSIWYGLGRTRGASVLRLLCKISLEPSACARMADGAIRRGGPRFLLVAKFVPGLGLMVAPLIGEARVPYRHFFALDAVAVSFWAGAYMALGRLLRETIGRSDRLTTVAAHFGAALLACGVVVAVVMLLVRRSRYGKRSSAPRIGAAELKGRLERGESPWIFDLRRPERSDDPGPSLPGALRLSPSEVLARAASIPPDRDVILLCDCPADAGSVAVAETLQQLGIVRAVVLEGGWSAWVRAGYPLVPHEPLQAGNRIESQRRGNPLEITLLG